MFFNSMQVTLNRTPYYVNKFPVFKSTSDFCRLPGGKEIGNNSWLFRDGIDWKAFAEYQIRNFADKDRVKVVQLGASDGSEGYTYAMSLLELENNQVSKFFPLMGFDIDRNIVEKAQSGILKLSDKDLARLKNLNIDYKKYFQKTDEDLVSKTYNIMSSESYHPYKVSEELRKRIIFEVGDMFNIIKHLEDDSNTVMLCRNVMIYLDEVLNEHFISMVGKKLKTGSLFVIGKLDSELEYMEGLLSKFGFKKVMNNIYRRL